jgi:hypothetical protein
MGAIVPHTNGLEQLIVTPDMLLCPVVVARIPYHILVPALPVAMLLAKRHVLTVEEISFTALTFDTNFTFTFEKKFHTTLGYCDMHGCNNGRGNLQVTERI